MQKRKNKAKELKKIGRDKTNAKQSLIEENAKKSMSEDGQRKLYLNESHADAKKADANAKKAVYTRRKGAVCLFGNRGSRYAENPNPNGKNPYCPPPRGTVNTRVCKGTPKPNYLCPSFGLTLAASDKQENNNFCVTLYSDKGLDDLSERCSQQLSDVRGRLQANKDLYEQQTAELQKHVDEFKRFGDNENDKYSIEAYCAENNAANEGRQSQECNQILAAIENLRNKGVAVNNPPPAPADSKPSTDTLPEANPPENTPPAANQPEESPVKEQAPHTEPVLHSI
jgi:hypothetical protein